MDLIREEFYIKGELVKKALEAERIIKIIEKNKKALEENKKVLEENM